MKWWREYWFRPAPLLDLAVLRITAVGLQLILLMNGHQWIARLHAFSELPDQWYQPLPILRLLTFPFGSPYRPSVEVLEVIWVVTVITGIFALIGLLTNRSLLIFAAGNVFIQAYLYSFGDHHHPEAVMMIALFVLALSPCGRVLSIDHWLRARATSGGPFGLDSLTQESPFARWPILTIQWVFVLMYLSAVLSKLVFYGPNWLNGFTLQGYLIRDGIRWHSPLALWLAQHHLLVLGLQYLTIAFQSTFVLAVVFPKLRWIYVPVGLGFHIGILLTLRADFYQWIALYVVFIPWAQALQLASRYLGARGLMTTRGAT
jgi:HTTM domain